MLMGSTAEDAAMLPADPVWGGVSSTLVQVAAGLEAATRSLAADSAHGLRAERFAGGFDDDLLLCDPTPLLDMLSTDLPGFDATHTMGAGHFDPFA